MTEHDVYQEKPRNDITVKKGIKWIAVIRDVAILFAVSFGMSFLLRWIDFSLIPFISFITFSIIFAVLGCAAKTNRWKHLFLVAGIAFVISLIWSVVHYYRNEIPIPIQNIIVPLFVRQFVSVVTGGFVSYLFVPAVTEGTHNTVTGKYSALAIVSFGLSLWILLQIGQLYFGLINVIDMGAMMPVNWCFVLIAGAFGIGALVQRCFVKRRFWWFGCLGIAISVFLVIQLFALCANMPYG